MKTLNTILNKLKSKFRETRGDAASDTMIIIIIGIALAIAVVSVLSNSFSEIATVVVDKLEAMISGT